MSGVSSIYDSKSKGIEERNREVQSMKDRELNSVAVKVETHAKNTVFTLKVLSI